MHLKALIFKCSGLKILREAAKKVPPLIQKYEKNTRNKLNRNRKYGIYDSFLKHIPELENERSIQTKRYLL